MPPRNSTKFDAIIVVTISKRLDTFSVLKACHSAQVLILIPQTIDHGVLFLRMTLLLLRLILLLLGLILLREDHVLYVGSSTWTE